MRMKALRSPLFITSSLLFVLHQLLQRGLGIHLPPLDAWLDNLVAMPIILTLLVVERRLLFRCPPSYRLSGAEVGVATLCISMVSELLFPLFSPRFTLDWLDFVFYTTGAALYLVQQRSSTGATRPGSGNRLSYRRR